MQNSTVLIVVGKDASLDDLSRKLESIRKVSARAAICVVGEIQAFPFYAVGIPPYGISEIPPDWQEDIAAYKAELKALADEIEVLLGQHDVSGGVDVVASDITTVADAVAQRAMFCDVALLSDDLRETAPLFNQVVHSVLFQSPVALLLNDNFGEALSGAKRVLVAWNTQLHSARAVHQALPILRNAQEVTIATIDPPMSKHGETGDPGVDVAKWLTSHGCKVVVQQYPSGGMDVGDCLLARAKEIGADLIVMGSYGHSRTRQAFFGGTTRTLIAQTKQGVFLAH